MKRTAIARFDTASFSMTPEGYLDAAVQPTRTGIFIYYYGGKMVRELRRPEEVFKADSLQSLVNKPVTNGHPRDATGMHIFLDANTARSYDVGHVYGTHEPADDGVHTQSRVLIKDAAMISQIKSGKVQVSCGYECDYNDTPGEYQGMKYDREQINIRNYNHLAIVDRGRAGSGVAIKFDGAEIDTEQQSSTIGDQPMIKVKFDGQDIEVSESAAQTIIEAEAKRKADASQIQQLTEQVSNAQTKFDELTGEFKAQEIELKQYREQAAKAKLDSIKAQAAEHVAAEKLDGLETEIEVKQAVIAAKFDGEDLSDKSEGYIDGMYKAAIKMPAQPESSNLKKIDSAMGNGNPFAGQDLISVARAENLKEIRG